MRGVMVVVHQSQTWTLALGTESQGLNPTAGHGLVDPGLTPRTYSNNRR